MLPPAQRLSRADVLDTVWRPAPLLMACCFLAYSAQFLAVISFFPTLLLERYIEHSDLMDLVAWQERSRVERFSENAARLVGPLL